MSAKQHNSTCLVRSAGERHHGRERVELRGILELQGLHGFVPAIGDSAFHCTRMGFGEARGNPSGITGNAQRPVAHGTDRASGTHTPSQNQRCSAHNRFHRISPAASCSSPLSIAEFTRGGLRFRASLRGLSGIPGGPAFS
jgi:hypothetical protein